MNSEVYSLLILKFANQITIQSTGHNIIQRPLRVATFYVLASYWFFWRTVTKFHSSIRNSVLEIRLPN